MRWLLVRSATARCLRRFAMVIVVFTALASSGMAPAFAVARPAQWRLVDLGASDWQYWSMAAAINDRGDVVGSRWNEDASGVQHATVWWHDGQVIELASLEGNYSTSASDINNRGEVVGMASTMYGSRPVVWRHERVIDLATPEDEGGFASAINDRGEIVGMVGSVTLRTVVWRHGRFTVLRMPPGETFTPTDINNRGEIVGVHVTNGLDPAPALWRRGTLTRLTSDLGEATAINDRGDIAINLYGRGAFVWSHGNLTAVAVPGAGVPRVADINNRGTVVGSVSGDLNLEAFVWRRGKATLLPTIEGGETYASAVNAAGQVAGFSYSMPDGRFVHAVVWIR